MEGVDLRKFQTEGEDHEKIKSIMTKAAKKVIGCNIQVDTKLITHAFRQDKTHQDRWNTLYEKLLKAKRRCLKYGQYLFQKRTVPD